jgi:hypothetical protein
MSQDSNDKNKNKDFNVEQFVNELVIKMALTEQILLPAIMNCHNVGIDDRFIALACMDISRGLVEGLMAQGAVMMDGKPLTWEEGLKRYSKIFKESAFGNTMRSFLKSRNKNTNQS